MNCLSVIHLELTSRCNKACWMCGRRKIERDYPHLAQWGDMPYEMVEKIAKQVPPGIVVQFHNNGEPTLYPRLREALDLFPNQIKAFNTNGKMLLQRAEDIIDHLDCLTLSVHQDDPEMDRQHEIMTRFWAIKGNRKPQVIYRLLGNVDSQPWRQHHLKGIIARRVFHDPMGSFNYRKKPTIPEFGICLDLLTHMAIDRYGNVSCCVRFDPEGKGILGSVIDNTLEEIWNGELRQQWIEHHKRGQRDLVPLCASCAFWGCPVSP